MYCLKHRETHAIALCMGCGAAVCGDCVRRTMGQRIVCSALCEQQLGQLLAASSEGLVRAARANAANALFVWLLGLTLFLYSGYTFIVWKNWNFVVYGVPMGMGCIAVGFFFHKLSKKTPNPPPHSDAPQKGGAPVG